MTKPLVLAEWMTVPIGLPRPRNSRGLPVPYVASSPNEMGTTSPSRVMLCTIDRRCQVCGDRIHGFAVVLGRAGDRFAIDHAPLHPDRCYPMAKRHCPFLAGMIGEGTLYEWHVAAVELATIGNQLVIPAGDGLQVAV